MPAKSRSSTVGFVSLGCPKALVDSERILTQLRAEGYLISPSYEGADLVVVNTCGFIDSAVAESLDAIGEALEENGKVIVTGCLGAKGDVVRETYRAGRVLSLGLTWRIEGKTLHLEIEGLRINATVVPGIFLGVAVTAGFALSALATAGILLLAPMWRDALMRWTPRWVAEAVSVPLAAQVACTPVVAALSGQVSLVAVGANLLAAPAVAPATVLGLAGGLLGLLWMPIGEVVAAPAAWSAGWIIAVARWGASVPTAAVEDTYTASSPPFRSRVVAVDVPFQLWDHQRQLKMTKQEVKEEYKRRESDPMVKARLRRMQQAGLQPLQHERRRSRGALARARGRSLRAALPSRRWDRAHGRLPDETLSPVR